MGGKAQGFLSPTKWLVQRAYRDAGAPVISPSSRLGATGPDGAEVFRAVVHDLARDLSPTTDGISNKSNGPKYLIKALLSRKTRTLSTRCVWNIISTESQRIPKREKKNTVKDACARVTKASPTGSWPSLRRILKWRGTVLSPESGKARETQDRYSGHAFFFEPLTEKEEKYKEGRLKRSRVEERENKKRTKIFFKKAQGFLARESKSLEVIEERSPGIRSLGSLALNFELVSGSETQSA